MQQITGKTSLTGLLGSPVAHSISPLMHNFSFQHLGIDWVYLCFDVKEEGLEDAVKGLRTLQVKGFNRIKTGFSSIWMSFLQQQD